MLFLQIFLFLIFFSTFPTTSPKKLRKLTPKEVKFGNENAYKFHSGKCSFFCFFVPLEGQIDQMIDLSFSHELSCSHIVYGFAIVDDRRVHLPTQKDLIPSSSFGNFRLITALQQLRNGPQVLLGIKEIFYAPRARFLQNAELARNVSQRMVFHARRYGFSGIFLKFDSKVLPSVGFEHFVEILADEVKKDAKTVKKNKLDMVLSISSHLTRFVLPQIAKFNSFFDTFYLWADETKSVEEPSPGQAVPVDPLHHSAERVPRGDGFAESAERFVATGVSRRKIVIGLSAWTRSYELATDKQHKKAEQQKERRQREAEERHNEAEGEAEVGAMPRGDGKEPSGNRTNQTEGQLPFQEFCALRGNGQMNYENISETMIYTEGKMGYSNNEPNHVSFLHKLNWIRDNQFGGIGLYSIQADDPNGTCSFGKFPLHQNLAKHFKCQMGSRRGAKAAGTDGQMPCMRMCVVDLDREVTGKLDLANFGTDWCSHLVLASAKMNGILRPIPTKGLEKAVKMYDEWEQNNKPFLVISFTGTAEQWRLATLGLARFHLIEQIRAVANSFDADGIDINCSNGGPDMPIFVANFGKFLSELRRKIRHKKIFLTIAPSSFSDNPNYDYELFDQSVDYFIAVGYRFHRHNNPHTGHHSPMFGSHDLLTQPRMTIQGMTEDLLHGHIPAEKAMSMRFAEDLSEDAQPNGRRNWESHRIGEPAAMAYGTVRNRALAHGVVTQTELCDILKEQQVHSRFVSDLAVPYLVNKDNEFIAFDNKRSIQIKTVWISLNGFAGIALHGVELDNANGKCPPGEPFPILRQIVETQICTKCSIDNATVPSSANDLTISSASVQITPVPIVSSKEQFIAKAISDYGKRLEREGTDRTNRRHSLSADDPANVMLSTDISELPLQTQKKEGQKEKCRSDGRFSLLCALNLSTNITDDLMTMEICDSFLLFDHFELTSDGTVKVSKMAEKWASKMGGENGTKKEKRKLWAEVNCSMKSEEWEKLLKENRHKIVQSLAEFTVERNLSGIVFNCDRQQNGKVRGEFAELVEELMTKGTGEGDQCEGIGLALKLPLHRVVLSEAYDVKALNRHAVTLLLGIGTAFSKQKSRLLNPLFSVGIAQQSETQTQNGTFAAWISEGVNAAQVVMEVPAFGLLQKRETDEQTEPKQIGRTEICKFQQKMGSIGRTQYDSICSYWNTGDEWVSSENEETAKYKAHWAIARRLGGVLLRSLDDDDPKNACRSGAFPLLHALHEARCRQKKTDFVAMRDLMGTHMSRG